MTESKSKQRIIIPANPGFSAVKPVWGDDSFCGLSVTPIIAWELVSGDDDTIECTVPITPEWDVHWDWVEQKYRALQYPDGSYSVVDDQRVDTAAEVIKIFQQLYAYENEHKAKRRAAAKSEAVS